jgi:hypothetical protein
MYIPRAPAVFVDRQIVGHRSCAGCIPTLRGVIAIEYVKVGAVDCTRSEAMKPIERYKKCVKT